MDRLLYKFKSLHNVEQVFDILQNQRLFCTKYSNLNDPFEGLFLATISRYAPFLGDIRTLKTHKSKIPKRVDDLYAQLEHTKVCSLSANLNDVRLWSLYADSHKGIAIAIDFSGIESNLHKVKYSKELPEFGNTLLGSPMPPEVLSRKTNHWEYEAEYRVIQDTNYYLINGRIKAVYTGQRISDFHIELLKKITPAEIPIYTTKLNTENVAIELDKLLR